MREETKTRKRLRSPTSGGFTILPYVTDERDAKFSLLSQSCRFQRWRVLRPQNAFALGTQRRDNVRVCPALLFFTCYLLYCNIIWGCANKSTIKSLHLIQKKAFAQFFTLNIILILFYYSNLQKFSLNLILFISHNSGALLWRLW